jgi:hypothetical protein
MTGGRTTDALPWLHVYTRGCTYTLMQSASGELSANSVVRRLAFFLSVGEGIENCVKEPKR